MITLRKQHRRYDKYRDSGVEWLNELPDKWEIKKLKHCTHCLDSRRVPLNSEERGMMIGDIPYYGANGLVDTVNEYLFDEELVLLGEDGAPFLEKGKDVAFTINGKCWVNNHAHILRAGGINSRFLTYSLNTVDYSVWIDGSTRQKLTQNDMNNIPIVFPPLSEQASIASYLDEKCALIDSIIAKKKQQMKLLKEKRSAIINRAVTRGLEEDVEMKESGVKWLPKIPKLWNIIPLRRFVKMKGGSTPSKEVAKYWNGKIPWVSPKDMKSESITVSEDTISKEGQIAANLELIPDDSVLIVVRSGILKHTLPVSINIIPACLNQDMKALICNSELILSDYLFLLLKGLNNDVLIQTSKIGATVESIEINYLRDLQLPIPSIKEQRKIINEVNKSIHKYEHPKIVLEQSLSLLTEYKTSLIAHAVTGRIKVA